MHAALVAVSLFSVLEARSAQALRLRVDWRATVPDIVSAGYGELSGSLGVFEVTGVGQEFALPADGSLSVTATGFTGGFPNGTFPFEEFDPIIVGAGTGLKLRFDALGPTPAVSLIPVGANLAYLSTYSQTTPCSVGGGVGFCGIVLGENLDQDLIEGDLAGIYANTPGVGNQARAAEVRYSFTVVTVTPVPAARGPARWLLGSLIIASAAWALRRRGSLVFRVTWARVATSTRTR
jgi:hypothetical protein